MNTVARLIEPEVEALGYDLVRVAMIGGTSDPTLQVMAERPDTRQLDLADCERISRRLSEVLDLSTRSKAAIGSRSARRDRPAAHPPQGLSRLGRVTKRASRSPSRKASRKQYSGTLEGLDGDIVKLLGKDGETYEVPFSDIASAKLLLTDKLITSTAPLSTEGADAHQDGRLND